MTTVGIDEAGRGPVIGPMVMAGVLVTPEQEERLKNLNVRDSKLIAHGVREKLYSQIKDIVTAYHIVIVSAAEIDAVLQNPHDNLNHLEALKSAEIANELNGTKLILDCPSTNLDAYRIRVESLLKKKYSVVCEHKADANYVACSAASILAKVTRDREIELIKKSIKEDFGSGYSSDPRTREFLARNWDRYPEIFRRSWATYKKVAEAKGQKGLGDY